MPLKKKKNGAQQSALFDAPRYDWKNVREVEPPDLIVVAQQEVKILGIRPEGDFWLVRYVDPDTHAKTEQNTQQKDLK